MKHTTWIVVVLVVLVGGYFIFSGDTTVDETGPITIGFIGPLSGDAAVYGEPARNITELAVAEINADGGIDGRELRVVYEDGQCNGADATSAAQKLVGVDKVKVIIGGFCSSESLAAVPVAQNGGVFLLSPGSSSPDLTGVSNMFARVYPSDASQGKVLAEVAYNDNGWRKVAFIQEQTDYALGIYNAFTEAFEELGGEVVKEEFPTEVSDFRTIITKTKEQKPDAVYLDTQTPAAADRILVQMKELKWNPPFLVSDVLTDSEFVSKHADILEGSFGAIFALDEGNTSFADLLVKYKSTYGSDMPFQTYGQTEYDAIYMLRDAILEVGHDSKKIAKWFAEVKDWQGASGLITIGNDGDRDGGHTPQVIKNGTLIPYSAE